MLQTNPSPSPSGRPSTAPVTEYVWRPQAGPQKALVDCPVREVFFGGARGGGKTDGVLGKYALKAKRYGDGFNALFCRRELPMLDDAIARSQEIYEPLGARWNDQKKTWIFRGGGRLRFRPLERVQDADKYQGQNVSDVCIEEAGIYPDPKPIDRMFGILRSAKGVPTQMILTGNPGGAGQGWIRERYIDPAPMGMKLLERKLPNGAVHRYVFIPSRIADNRLLVSKDPDYINNLYLVGSEQLVKAWLAGDWSAVEGAFFDGWRNDKHVVDPFPIPAHWLRFVAMDWGFAAPFAIYWFAVASDDCVVGSVRIPRGCLVAYREWYGAGGARLQADDIAKGILARERAAGERRGGDANEAAIVGGAPAISYSVLDPSCWSVQAISGGPSIAEQMAKEGVFFQRADNRRTPHAGAQSGWDLMRARLRGDAQGNPMLVFTTDCPNAIRTIPVLQHDPLNPEDLDTKAEDHAADAVRYGSSSRPYVRDAAKTEQPKILSVGETNQVSLEDLWPEPSPSFEARI